MCNPRRVMIHLARSIEEAWRQSVEQSATAGQEVNEMARITADVRLSEEMGDAALEMLERVLAGEFEEFEPWVRDVAGRYRRDLYEVAMIFDPRTGNLTIEAGLAELVSAEGRGIAEACGFTVGEVAVEAVGRYYDDNWGGRTRERAEADALRQAEIKLDEAIEALHRNQRKEALAEAEAKAQAEAVANAAQELNRLQTQARELLRNRLQLVLERAQERVHHVMNRAVGEAYRQTLRSIVMKSGGRVLKDERTGSVIHMELEL